MIWLRQLIEKSLSRKLYFALAASVTAMSLGFLLLFVGYYRDKLVSERARTSAEVNAVVQLALENAMLKRDIDGLQGIVSRLGEAPNVRALMILNPDGEVRFTSQPELMNARIDLNDLGFCGGCRLSADAGLQTSVVTMAGGRDVLRSVNPIANRAPCQECHGAMSANPVNGILVLDYDDGALRDEALKMALALAGSGLVVLLIGASAVGWALRRTVVGPVKALSEASLALADGSGAIPAVANGEDEVADLARNLTEMSRRIASQRAALIESERFLQTTIDAIPDGIRVIDEDYKVVKANRAFCEQQKHPMSDVIGRPCYASSHAADEPCAPTLVTCPLVELDKSAGPITCRHVHVASDKSELAVEVSAARLDIETDGRRQRLIVECIRDLSIDLNHSQEQRLSEIGQLAAGVAHEIRNPLSSIHLALQSLRKEIATPAIDEHLNLMDEEIDRCIQITERLLRLSMPPSERPELVDLAVLIPEVVSLLAAEAAAYGISVDLDIARPLRVIAADSDMRMLALNLAQNAFHAMERGGTLSITGRPRGESVEIVFADEGVGIDAGDLPRIFQPFWSRRADGSQGTGLGLPICREILRRHSGTITVDSTLGSGTRFTVTLPWAEEPADAS